MAKTSLGAWFTRRRGLQEGGVAYTRRVLYIFKIQDFLHFELKVGVVYTRAWFYGKEWLTQEWGVTYTSEYGTILTKNKSTVLTF